MLFVEGFSLLVLVLFVAVSEDRVGTLRTAALIALGAFLGEDTCIRFYEFYSYSYGWHVFVDKVPLTVLLIWPAVVLSATRIARALVPRPTPRRLGLLVFALVVFDAALIEPIAVHARLWHWTHQGIFQVPVIGILGWGFYAGSMVALLEHLRGRARLAAPLLAPIAAHALLLVSWWGLFRYTLRFDLPVHVCVGLVLPASIVYASTAFRARAALGVGDLAARAAATSLFVYLLARDPRIDLLLYGSAFTLPHLVIVASSVSARLRRAPSPRAPA